MADRDAAFVGSIPEKYDRYLGPIYFHHYADDVAARLAVAPNMRVLETACGTGILTQRLVRRLKGQGTVVATDLNEPMIVYAQQKGFGDSALEWRQADATKLPFEDTSFEAETGTAWEAFGRADGGRPLLITQEAAFTARHSFRDLVDRLARAAWQLATNRHKVHQDAVEGEFGPHTDYADQDVRRQPRQGR